VATDVRLVVDAAEGHAGELPAQRAGDRLAERRLAHARRSDQGDDRARTAAAKHLEPALLAQLAHGQELDDAVLDLLDVVVVLVEHPAGVLDGNLDPFMEASLAQKAFGGGPSNVGFGMVEKAVDRFLPAASDGSQAFGKADILRTLKANWINGVAEADQKAKAKALIHLRLTNYLEQRAVYDAYNFMLGDVLNGTSVPANTTVMATAIPGYLCPSDPNPGSTEALAGPRITRRRARLSDRVRGERRLAAMLVGPAAIVMIAVTAYPIIDAVILSLQRSDLRFPSQTKFIGLANYGHVLGSSVWWQDVLHTTIITVITVAVQLVSSGSANEAVAVARRPCSIARFVPPPSARPTIWRPSAR